MPSAHRNSPSTMEATVTSKGQITLPSELRRRLGIRQGSRIRFSLPPDGPVQFEPLRSELEDLWRFVDAAPKSKRPMSFAEMDTAKARGRW